jgi:DNA-directed RNA polymerase specialized sigma54-like protein
MVYRCDTTTSGNTLLPWMRLCIIRKNFLDGDETKLKPMILKDIADMVGLDISTISRGKQQVCRNALWYKTD